MIGCGVRSRSGSRRWSDGWTWPRGAWPSCTTSAWATGGDVSDAEVLLIATVAASATRGLVLLIAAMQVLRIIRHYVRRTQPPLLLVRDALLFIVFSLLILGGLGPVSAWLLLTSSLVLGALLFYVAIEIGAVGRAHQEPEP